MAASVWMLHCGHFYHSWTKFPLLAVKKTFCPILNVMKVCPNHLSHVFFLKESSLSGHFLRPLLKMIREK